AAATAIASKAISVTSTTMPPLVLRYAGLNIERGALCRVAAVVTRPACKVNRASGQRIYAARADRRRPHCLRHRSSFLFLLRLDGLVLVQLLAWLTGHPGGLVQVPVPARWLLLHGQSMRHRRTESKRRCPKGHGGFSGQPLRLVSSSVSCGATVNRSPTTPKSASSKIGASGSLLMATMVLDVCMPARCWIAPEIPTAMYNCGDTVTPVWPTCILCGTPPASVAARDAPTAAPSES